MDDRTFDEPAAREWIRTIENATNPVREQDIYPILRKWIKIASPQRVLEIGCGQGACSSRLDLADRSYVGIDPSPFLIQRARELHESEQCRFQLGNAYALPFADRQFEAAFSVMVWHLLSDIQTAAREMNRVLGPRGHFLIVTANPDAFAEWAELYRNPQIAGRRLEGDMQIDGRIIDHDVLHIHTLDALVAALRLAKFETTSVEPFRKSRRGQGREFLVSIQGRLRH